MKVLADKILAQENKVIRHRFSVIFVHWTIAISTILLIYSGFFSGFGSLGNLSLLHYIAAAVLLFAVGYHVVYHVLLKEYGILPQKGDLKASYQIIKSMLAGGKEPPSEKFLAEQRLAYAYIAFWMLLVIITGAVRVLIGIGILGRNMAIIGELHALAVTMLIFGILAHLAAFLFKSNRPLIWSMFTGKVDLDYVKHRHSLWYERLIKADKHPSARSLDKTHSPGKPGMKNSGKRKR